MAFRAMKSSGFNIEDTHMRDIERISRLLAVRWLSDMPKVVAYY